MGLAEIDEDQLVDYEEGEGGYVMASPVSDDGARASLMKTGGATLEDGELEHGGGAPAASSWNVQPLAEREARRVAIEYEVSIETVYASHKRGHDLRAESLQWMSLALELGIGTRGPHEQFRDWKENVAVAAQSCDKAHPWDKNRAFLGRYNRMTNDGRCGTFFFG